MSAWQRFTVSTGAHVGQPGPLPAELMGLSTDTLANLPDALSLAALMQLGFVDTGFTPVSDPAPPEELQRQSRPKSVIMARAMTLGKGPAIKALFDANYALQWEWFSPDRPNIFLDDAAMLAALAAIGCTDEEKAIITSADT